MSRKVQGNELAVDLPPNRFIASMVSPRGPDAKSSLANSSGLLSPSSSTGRLPGSSARLASPRRTVKGEMPETIIEDLVQPLINDDASEAEEPNSESQLGDIVCAAWIIEDALDGHHAEEYAFGAEAKALRKRVNLVFYGKRSIFYTTVMLVLMSFIEVPLWCNPESTAEDTKFVSYDYCPLRDSHGVWLTRERYKNVMFNGNVLPPKYSMFLEAVAMGVLTIALLYEFKLSQDLGPKRRLSICMPGRFLLIMGIMWIDLLIYYHFWLRDHFLSYRIAPYGRVFLLFYGQRVRSVFSSVVHCLDEFASVVVFLVGCCLFFAWMMYNVMDDIHDNTGLSIAEISGDAENFGSFSQTLLTFFTIMTGAAFPDDVCTVFQRNHWYVLIFYPFMGLSAFLFTQLMLAIIYNAYSRETKKTLKDFYVQRAKGLAKTFSILAVENDEEEKVMLMDTFIALVNVLSAWPRFRGRLRTEDAKVLYGALDFDGNGVLSMDEFLDACSTLQYTITTTDYKSGLVKSGTYGLVNKLNLFVDLGGLAISTEAILVGNAMFIAVQSYFDFTDLGEPHGFKQVEFFFSVIYMLEVAVKLLVFSFHFYWAHASNRFDFFVSWLLFLGGLLNFYDIQTGLPLDNMMQYFNILRILRLLRLLTQVPSLRKMCVAIAKFCQVSGDMVILFFVSTLLFAIVGVQAFGGLLFRGAPNLPDSSDYIDGQEDVLNFNDLTGAFLSLTDMMINSYQPEYAKAMDSVMPSIPLIGPHAGEIYCGAVFLLSVNIAFNIFTAFLIEIFVSIQQTMDPGGEDDVQEKKLDAVRKMVKENGQVLHFVEPTEVLRLRTLTGIIEGLDEIIQEENEQAVRIIRGAPKKTKKILHEPTTAMMTSLSEMFQAMTG